MERGVLISHTWYHIGGWCSIWLLLIAVVACGPGTRRRLPLARFAFGLHSVPFSSFTDLEQIIVSHSSRSRYFNADRSTLNLACLFDLAHVAGWDPYNRHGLGHISWVGSVLCIDPAQPFTAGEELDDKFADRS